MNKVHTNVKVEEYIKTGGSTCPFCEQGKVEASEQGEYDPYVLPVRCPKCQKEWVEILGIIGISYDGIDLVTKDEYAIL